MVGYDRLLEVDAIASLAADLRSELPSVDTRLFAFACHGEIVATLKALHERRALHRVVVCDLGRIHLTVTGFADEARRARIVDPERALGVLEGAMHEGVPRGREVLERLAHLVTVRAEATRLETELARIVETYGVSA